MQEKIVKIGLVGFGTVGSGVAKIILEDADRLADKTGLRLQLACVVDSDLKRERPVQLPQGILTNDLNKLLSDKSIQIGIELVGGTGIAKEIQLKLLAAGKDVVTANKALLAKHGIELYAAAEKADRCIAFEASCAGGIPIISGIRTGLAANDISAIYGIVNGTCNYILSKMTSNAEEFAEALAQAQQRGYAEADPIIDISGGDSAHKLAILASIAFGCQISLDDIYVEGIQHVSKTDVQFGGEMGYMLKLLAIAEKNQQGRISLRVHPSFVNSENRLAQVDGSFNAISIFGHAVGNVLFIGRGAGMLPTASAVVADVIDVALGNSATIFNHLRLKPRNEVVGLIDKIDNLVSRFYIRLMAKDQPGVFAQVGKVLADNAISISGVLQHEAHGPDDSVPVVITTHPNRQANITAALKGLADLNTVSAAPVCIRIVDIPEDNE
ncbi:MAG: homoserine dehydrogenase [Sedimentisphaerales bacterium]|nr:homoserine dehydrogenase [Sedimentisphaerales bacterium]